MRGGGGGGRSYCDREVVPGNGAKKEKKAADVGSGCRIAQEDECLGMR